MPKRSVQRLSQYGDGKRLTRIQAFGDRAILAVAGGMYLIPFWGTLSISAERATCSPTLFGICLAAGSPSSNSIFGFAEFVQALALLVIVYTVTDVRYRFRIAVAPIPVAALTFLATGVIGVFSLVGDIIFATSIPLPPALQHQSIWQTILGFAFLLTILVWMWFAFIRAPVFGRYNYDKFARTLYAYIVRGSDSELPTIAAELARSAVSLIALADEVRPRAISRQPTRANRIGPSQYAREILLLIGNRKFCRSIIEEAPGAAIVFFTAMSERRKYALPIGQFATNLTTEAVSNKDSLIYHEDAGFYSGLIGYAKPFSNALYGDYELVEALAAQNQSPFDVNYKTRWAWDAAQVEAFGRIILITFDTYVSGGYWGRHSYALLRAFSDMHEAARDIHKLDGTEAYDADAVNRLQASVSFVEDAMRILNAHENQFDTTLRMRGNKYGHFDPYDMIAESMFEIIFIASSITRPTGFCWQIQYGSVWSRFFRHPGGKADAIVLFKLRRLLYDEIVKMDSYPNFKSARFLSICLNVMGVRPDKKGSFAKYENALHRAIIMWVRKNYLQLREDSPDVAKACLTGWISFDDARNSLVKTYLKGLHREAPTDVLALDPPNSNPNA